MEALLDTNILIDYLGGHHPAKKELELYKNPCISIISWMEVLIGSQNGEEEKYCREFLSLFKILSLTPEISEIAVGIRRENRIKLPDAIILASAQAHKLLLVTRNSKDFPKNRPGIRIPYQL